MQTQSAVKHIVWTKSWNKWQFHIIIQMHRPFHKFSSRNIELNKLSKKPQLASRTYNSCQQYTHYISVPIIDSNKPSKLNSTTIIFYAHVKCLQHTKIEELQQSNSILITHNQRHYSSYHSIRSHSNIRLTPIHK